MKDVKEKKCGCIYFEVGPPVLCGRHLQREIKKAEREKVREEKGLRKVVAETAFTNGHDLSKFKEYGSRPGKWTAHCHSCGSMVIVYDQPPERGDQVSGKALFEPCAKSSLVQVLGEADRATIAAKFNKEGEVSGEEPEVVESEGTDTGRTRRGQSSRIVGS